MGHGSAICARGIFEGFSLSPSADQIPSPEIPFFSFVGAPVKCRWLETSFSRVRSAAGEEGSALRLGETEKERTQTPQAFQTIVIPTGLQRPPGLFPLKVIVRPKATRTPLVLPGRRVGHSEFGFDKHAEERSAVHTSVIL